MAQGQTAAIEESEGDVGQLLVISSEDLSEELSCPICFKIMSDAVIAEDDHTYQRQAIEQWINRCIAGTVPETHM